MFAFRCIVGRVEVYESSAFDDNLRASVLICGIDAVKQEVITVRFAERLDGKDSAVYRKFALLYLNGSTAAVIIPPFIVSFAPLRTFMP